MPLGSVEVVGALVQGNRVVRIPGGERFIPPLAWRTETLNYQPPRFSAQFYGIVESSNVQQRLGNSDSARVSNTNEGGPHDNLITSYPRPTCYHTCGMACPYFDPVAPDSRDTGPENAMLPLGGVWEGLCRAVPDQPCQPDRDILQPLCNLGYARGTCARFPGGEAPDAVRFTVSSDDGASVKLYYVIERDHHPFAHGPVDHPAAILERQADAYLRSYRRRKMELHGR